MNYTFTNDNGFTGTTNVVSGASLTLGNGGSTGSVGGSISNAGTLTFNRTGMVTNVITGVGTVVKAGTTTLTFARAFTYTGSTAVNGGTLVLDFSAAGAPASNILYNTGTPGTLTLGGGTLSVVGSGTQANSQTVGPLNLSFNGASTVAVTAGAGQNATLNTGAITRGTYSTINFALTNNGLGVASVSTGATAGAAGIVGGYATLNGTDWFTGTGDYATYTNDNFTATNSNVTVTATQSPATFNVATVRFNTPTAAPLTVVGTNTLTEGGILVTPNVGTNPTTIAPAAGGGSLTAPVGTPVYVQQFNTAAPLTISAVVGDTPNNTAQNGTFTSGSAAVSSLASTAGFYIGQGVSGAGIPVGARVLSITSGTAITLTQNTTAAGTGTPVTFNTGTSLVKSGPGTLALTATNAFTGQLVLEAGVVSVTSLNNIGPNSTGVPTGSPLPSTSNSIFFNGGTLQFNGTYNMTTAGNQPMVFGPAGGTIDVTAGNIIITNGINFIRGGGSGALTKTGDGTIGIGSGASTLAGPIFINAGTIREYSSQLESISAMTVAPGGQFEINDDATATFRIATAGVITLNGNGPAAAPGALRLSDQNGNGTLGPTTTISNVITLASDSLVTVVKLNARASNLILSGAVTGPGNLTKSGTGTFTLSNAANAYGGAAGTTTVLDGTLQISVGANRLPTTTSLVLGDAATNTSGVFNLGGFDQTVAGLTTAGTGTTNRVLNTSATAATFTLNYAGATPQTFDGQIGGGAANNALGFTKSGVGSVVLTGNNTYTGATTVNGGTLVVNGQTGTNSGTGSGAVAVAVGGTLAGTGRVGTGTAGSLAVAAGGTVAPGAVGAVGTLTVNTATAPAVSLAGGSTLAIKVGTGATVGSQLNVIGGGNVDLTGLSAATPLNIPLSAVGPLTEGQTYTLTVLSTAGGTGTINYPTGGFLPSQFNVTASGFGADANGFTINGTSTAVTVSFTTPVPEPATGLGLAAAGLCLVGWARRRRG